MDQRKLTQTLAVMAAGFAATKALDMIWRGVFGHRPPGPGDESDSPVREIVMFAAISGAIAAIARIGAARAANRFTARRVSGG